MFRFYDILKLLKAQNFHILNTSKNDIGDKKYFEIYAEKDNIEYNIFYEDYMFSIWKIHKGYEHLIMYNSYYNELKKFIKSI